MNLKRYSEWKERNDFLNEKRESTALKLDQKVKRQLDLRQQAIDKNDQSAIRTHEKKLSLLNSKKETSMVNINRALGSNAQTVRKDDIAYLGANNAHPLTENKVNQVAVDVGGGKQTDSGAEVRGPKRFIWNIYEKPNGEIQRLHKRSQLRHYQELRRPKRFPETFRERSNKLEDIGECS